MKPRDAILWFVAAVWLAVILGGAWAWERYETTPGTVGPLNAGPAAEVGRWQITVYAHPHCPCTQSSLAELAAVAAAAPDLAVRVRIVRPSETSEGWERGHSWDAASQILNCDVACDLDGVEARRFGAATSGFAVLIDPAGRVAYRGGLTPGRGRKADDRSAILAILAGADAATVVAPVYGCPLLTPQN